MARDRSRAARRALRVAGAAGTVLVALGTGGSALANSGGVSSTPTGGTAYLSPPEIKGVSCVASCMSGGRVQSGGKLKLRGAKLAGVSRVVYLGAPGPGDDVAVNVRPSSDRTLQVPVPFGAQSGRLAAYAGRMHSTAPRAVKIMPPPAPEPNAQLSTAPGPVDAGAPRVETSTSRSLFAIDERGGVKFSYRLSGSPPASVQITLVRVDTGDVVQTWSPGPLPDGQVGTVTWNGLSGAAPAPSGRYAFRLLASSGAGAARSAAADDPRRDAFDLRPALFPVRGSHDYGGAGARFGAGRSGHTHQGQDVMAACGTPLIAARGGVVKASHFQSAAGNYIVIDGQNTSTDYGYMHLRTPSPYNVGDRVYTGDQIGVVGQTGDASACHLHFEEWTGPGWYSGGSPFDPLADLRAWDSWS